MVVGYLDFVTLGVREPSSLSTGCGEGRSFQILLSPLLPGSPALRTPHNAATPFHHRVSFC